MNGKVIELYTKEGDLVAYRPLSARLPAFLERFGPEKGYAVRTELMDSLSLKPGLLRLYEAALQAGRKPEELGLPPLALAGVVLVCRVTLEDAAGRVLATATAAKPIQVYKDLEVLETAARQRLLAALGFGGEALDVDEALDQHDQGLAAPPSVLPVPAPVPAVSAPAASAPAAPIPAVSAPAAPIPAASAPAASAPAASAPAASNPASAVPAAAPPERAAPETDPALTLLRRQIAHLAKMRGTDPPAVATRAEAQAALKALMQPAAG